MKRMLTGITVGLLVVLSAIVFSPKVRAQIQSGLRYSQPNHGSNYYNIGEGWDIVTPIPHDGVVDLLLYDKETGLARIISWGADQPDCYYLGQCL